VAHLLLMLAVEAVEMAMEMQPQTERMVVETE
jgi:hypothetical protein